MTLINQLEFDTRSLYFSQSSVKKYRCDFLESTNVPTKSGQIAESRILEIPATIPMRMIATAPVFPDSQMRCR